MSSWRREILTLSAVIVMSAGCARWGFDRGDATAGDGGGGHDAGDAGQTDAAGDRDATPCSCPAPRVCDPDGTCVLDETPPRIVVDSFRLAAGAATTGSALVGVEVQGEDDLTAITHFCLKYDDPSQPAATAGCWRDVQLRPPGLTPQKTLALEPAHGVFFRLGLLARAYTIYIWLRDAAGNATSLSNGGEGSEGTDRATIAYDPGHPPELRQILVASSDAPGVPQDDDDLVVPAGSDVFIKWRASDLEGLASAPIGLSYSEDGRTYVTIAEGLQNGLNPAAGGCTVDSPATTADDGATGCFHWAGGSPTSNSYRIRVAVEDDDQMVSMALSVPINAPRLRVLAGNTYPGTDGSARSAVFVSDLAEDARHGAQNLFVVLPSGRIFFRDLHRGLLEVAVDDGVQRVLIPATGSSTGDGGPARQATLTDPLLLALDHDDNLLLLDGERLRRIETRTPQMIIETVAGGGSDTADTVTDPRALRIQVQATWGLSLFALPNGDVYFPSEREQVGGRVRVYRAASGVVQSISPRGIGDAGDPTQDITLCYLHTFGLAYNPLSSVIDHAQITVRRTPSTPGCDNDWTGDFARLDPTGFTSAAPHPPRIHPDSQSNNYSVLHVGLDGRIYRTLRNQGTIYRFEVASNSWTTVVGSGVVGSCDDGTPALQCAIDPQDTFVDAQGTLYFVDRGRIRTLSAEARVYTLVGQGLASGDGGHPRDARLGTVNAIATDGDEIVLLDKTEYRIRAFGREGTMRTIAGNGVKGLTDLARPATQTALLSTHGWFDFDSFVAGPDGDLFLGLQTTDYDEAILRLDRGAGRWARLAGNNGSTDYYQAAGLPGDQIDFYLPPPVIGADESGVLAVPARITGSGDSDVYLAHYDLVDGTQTMIAGRSGSSSSSGICADGTVLTDCRLYRGTNGRWAQATYDGTTGPRWLLLIAGTRTIHAATIGDKMRTIATLPRDAVSFAHRPAAAGLPELVCYCGEDGRLYRFDLDTGQDAALSGQVSSIACSGRALLFDPARHSLIFPFVESGLTGIGEYLLSTP